MNDRDHPVEPTPLEFVREVLRGKPGATYQDVETAWRARHPAEEFTSLRREYDSEVRQARRGPPKVDSLYDHTLAGLLLTLALHCMMALMLYLIGNVTASGALTPGSINSTSDWIFRGDPGLLFVIGFIVWSGVAQFIYLAPAIVIAYRSRRPNLAKGLIIGACVTLLLNGVCWANGTFRRV